jgi:hypothetical protein
MGVILSVQRQKAFLRDGEWRCADSSLETRLNEATAAWIETTGGPKLSSEDPEIELAREMERQLGGRIVLQSAANRKRSARVYFAKRQYRLAFH